MKRFLVVFVLVSFFVLDFKTFAAKPSDFGLKEGDLISAIFSDDPDVYIINEHGYKRLFLNPEIFKFYAHLGGFASVKLVTPEIRDAFPTAGLFRNCEKNDPKVYGFESDDEDKGKLRWVDTPGEQAVKDDPDFFKKVFCINSKEFNWYKKAEELKSVNEVPKYDRIPATEQISTEKKLEAKAEIKDIGKAIICHYPPENIKAYQTLTIDVSALKAHLDHGDTIGVCLSSIVPTPTITITPVPTTTIGPTASQSFSLTPTPIFTVTPVPTTITGPVPSTSVSPSPTIAVTNTPTPTATSTSTPIPTPASTPIMNDSPPVITSLTIRSTSEAQPNTIYAGLSTDLYMTVTDDKGITYAGFNAPGMKYSSPDMTLYGCFSGSVSCSDHNSLTPDQPGSYTITAKVTDTAGQTVTKTITFNAAGCSTDLECGGSYFPSSGATFCGPSGAALYTQRLKYKVGTVCQASGSCNQSTDPGVLEDCGASGKICGFSPANGGQFQCVISPGVTCTPNAAITSSCLCGPSSYEQYGYCCQDANGNLYQTVSACSSISSKSYFFGSIFKSLSKLFRK